LRSKRERERQRESRQEDKRAKSSFLLHIYVYLIQKIKPSEINVFGLFVSCETHRIGLIGITLWPGFGTELCVNITVGQNVINR
jgi:hypothetical protein